MPKLSVALLISSDRFSWTICNAFTNIQQSEGHPRLLPYLSRYVYNPIHFISSTFSIKYNYIHVRRSKVRIRHFKIKNTN